jgi:magnesium transporter
MADTEQGTSAPGADATGSGVGASTTSTTSTHNTSSTTGSTASHIGRAFAGPLRSVTRIFTPGSHLTRAPMQAVSSGHAVVDCGFYVNGARQPGDWDYARALDAAQKQDDSFVWVGLHEPTLDDLIGIAETFELDDFAVEDAVKGGQRPKIEQYGEMTFLVMRTTRYVEHAELTETSEIVETGDLMLFIGPNYVITVRHGELSALGRIRADLEEQPELLGLGPWSVVYTILDKVVDNYLEVAARVEEDIDSIEANVFSRQVHGRISRIYQLKRELVEFKRAVVPLQRPLNALVDGRLGGMPPEVMRYFRDINDHLLRTVEQVMSYDDVLNSILQARLAQVTVDQNNDMRKIASWAAIAAMQTAIAGIYGMNFPNMPETKWRYGYGLILLVMFAAAIALYRLFRRSGWL